LESSWLEKLNQYGKIDSVVWAQGFNQSDNIVSFDIEVFNSHLITRKLFGKPFGQELRQNTRESEELGQLASER